MILPPTSQIGHHPKVTNKTMSPTSLSPFHSLGSKILKFLEFNLYILLKPDFRLLPFKCLPNFTPNRKSTYDLACIELTLGNEQEVPFFYFAFRDICNSQASNARFLYHNIVF